MNLLLLSLYQFDYIILTLNLKIIITILFKQFVHSKYNPIERTWAVLENHWNGSILDEIETALKFAQTMTWKGKHPIVKLITETYEKGVKLTKKAMEKIEEKIERLTESTNQDFPDLGQWFIDIYYDKT